MIDQRSYTNNLSSCEIKAWNFYYFFFQALISKLLNLWVSDCDGQLCLNIFLGSSNIWSFILSFVFFTFYGYIMNSQWEQIPDVLIAQFGTEHCTGIGIFDGFKSRSGLILCQALISQLLKLCVWLRWSIIFFFISMIFHIFICIFTFYRVYTNLQCDQSHLWWLDNSVS